MFPPNSFRFPTTTEAAGAAAAAAAGLKINHIFGDYHLSKFNTDTSERLIFVVS